MILTGHLLYESSCEARDEYKYIVTTTHVPTRIFICINAPTEQPLSHTAEGIIRGVRTGSLRESRIPQDNTTPTC